MRRRRDQRRPPRPNHRALWIAAGVLALAVLIISGAAANYSRQSTSPIPSPPAQTQVAQAYVQMTLRNVEAVNSAAGAAEQACKNAVAADTTADCRAKIEAEQAAIHSYQHDLDATPAPACLSEVDHSVRQALIAWNASISAQKKAIDNLDVGSLATANQLEKQGSDAMNTAGSRLKEATCQRDFHRLISA